MSEEDKIKENDPPSSHPINITTEEALGRLEDHRCAICQNIIINACRIDCGHTYCRHCLNVDRENRNHGTKPTCFICDAAVTEITHNAERDKEIDDIYMTLPTNERLSRARAKAVRLAEEENFNKRSKETNNDNLHPQEENESGQLGSNDSFGSGDASYNTGATSNITTDSANAWSWDDQNNDQRGPEQTFYGEGYRIWPNENGYCDLRASGSGEAFEYSNGTNLHSVSRERNGFNRGPSVVVHHTIQHVYHTVEVRNAAGESDAEGRESGCRTRLRQHPSRPSIEDNIYCTSNSSHMPIPFNVNEASGAGRNLSCGPCSCCDSRYPRYQASAPASFHGSNINSAIHANSHAQFYQRQCPHYGFQTHCPVIYSSTMPWRYVGSYHPHYALNRPSTSNFNRFRNVQSHGSADRNNYRETYTSEDTGSGNILHFHRGSDFGTENVSDEESENTVYLSQGHGETDSGFEGLCEFHRMERDQQRGSDESMTCSRSSLERTRSYNALLPQYSMSNDAIRGMRDPHMEEGDDDDREDENEEGNVITFRISVPLHEVQEQAIQRRNSSPEFLNLRRPIRRFIREPLQQ